MTPGSLPDSRRTRGSFASHSRGMATRSPSVLPRRHGRRGSGRRAHPECGPGDDDPDDREDSPDDGPGDVAVHEAGSGKEPQPLADPGGPDHDQDDGDDPACTHRDLLDGILATWTR